MEYVFNAIDDYAIMLRDTVVPFKVFAIYTLIIILVELIRFFMLLKFESVKTKHKFKSYSKIYIFGHICYETLASYVIAYFIIKITGAHWGSPIINFIIAPACGVLGGVIIDSKILIPSEGMSEGASLKNKKKEKDPSTVTVNINQQSDAQKINGYITDEMCDSETFNSDIAKVINGIKEVQEQHTNQINETIKLLTTLKDVEMHDKKIELKKLIYECLNNGFATPEQNDRITNMFQSYTSLGGNGEIETLYKEHYLKLKVHEDRRNGNHCSYGEFD